MTKITYTDEYVKTAARSKTDNIESLTHAQIAAFTTALKVCEADYIIEMAFNSHVNHLLEVDMNRFTKTETTLNK